MKTFHDIASLATLPGPVHLAIGFFDGVHLGHQEVIRRARDAAEADGGTAVIATFDPHPMKVLRPQSAPRLLTSTLHKTLILSHLGVTHLLVIPFDSDLAALTPDQFIGCLASAANPLGSVTVGYNWTFGKGRSGNLQTLSALGRTMGFQVHGVTPVVVGEEPVSSTRVRLAVERGDFHAASRLLGRDYSVHGTIVKGRQLARKLGFPTANLSLEAEQLPPIGVYAVRATVADQAFKGVANLGLRPTVEMDGSAKRQLEVHLFDHSGDLYGEGIEVRFIQRLRDEIKMDSLEALKTQIALDAAQARQVLEAGSGVGYGGMASLGGLGA
ncbi:MAG: bifunctional riboflavin kinase/FAD synthetase [Verrucomicrobiales bacterium]|nr:bifunctional riboflavin kinase/FAD synthetase [Verrucomicrobiales bacterium]